MYGGSYTLQNIVPTYWPATMNDKSGSVIVEAYGPPDTDYNGSNKITSTSNTGYFYKYIANDSSALLVTGERYTNLYTLNDSTFNDASKMDVTIPGTGTIIPGTQYHIDNNYGNGSPTSRIYLNTTDTLMSNIVDSNNADVAVTVTEPKNNILT